MGEYVKVSICPYNERFKKNCWCFRLCFHCIHENSWNILLFSVGRHTTTWDRAASGYHRSTYIFENTEDTISQVSNEVPGKRSLLVQGSW